jgi:dihydroneopterin aldolase
LRGTIVKLGGSLLGSADLDAWLSTFLDWGAPAVIVPGGGAFDDATAHHMALLAMEQVAVLLASRFCELALAASLDELVDARARGRTSVWLPSAMVLAAPDVPASWEVTSDSLAAWLAEALGATRLLIVKSRDVAGPVTSHILAEAGIVDPLFPCFAAKTAAEVFVAGPADLEGAGEVLRGGGMPGAPVRM